MSDNQAAVAAINKQTSSDLLEMILIRRFVVACLKFNTLVKAKHIPGKSNVIADRLSRFQIAAAREFAPWLDKEATAIPPMLLPWKDCRFTKQ